MYKLLSFDVYGTLVNTPPANAKAFRAILKDAGATNIDPVAFYDFWESRNIAQYRNPYRSYKAICRTSLEDAFAHYKVAGADPSLIEHFFAVCREMQLYPDVLPTLESCERVIASPLFPTSMMICFNPPPFRSSSILYVRPKGQRVTNLTGPYFDICLTTRACPSKKSCTPVNRNSPTSWAPNLWD
jgi:hypothetical protein